MGERHVVELRVHGVSGTPPEELLDRPLVRQVAGDKIAGFYRPQLASEILDKPIPEPPLGLPANAYLEGYAWGGLTSGAPSRALWLLLLPFALVNLAPRLRPARDGKITLPVLLTLSRVIALASTVTLTLGAAGIGVDLIGWQCGGRAADRCPALPDLVRTGFATWPLGLRLLAGAGLPILLLVVLWWVSRRTVERYESVPDSRSGKGSSAESRTPDEADVLDPALSDQWMWRGRHMVNRLRHLHLAGGVLAVVLLLSFALAPSALQALATALTGGALVLVVVSLGVSKIVGRRPTSQLGRLRWLGWAVWILTLASIGLVAWLLATGQVVEASGGMPGYDAMITISFALQLLLVLVVGAVVWRMGTGAPAQQPRPAFGGFGTILIASLGTLLGAAFTAGMYILTAAWLRTGQTVPGIDEVGRSRDAVPVSLQVAAVSFAYIAIVVLAAGIALLVVVVAGWLLPASKRLLNAAYPGRAPMLPGRDAQLRRIFWQAGLVDWTAPVVGVPLVLATLFAVVVTVPTLSVVLGGGWAGGAVARYLQADWLYGAGAYAAAGLLVLLVVLGVAVFRVRHTRRVVGILWDIASFWPRSVHPLAPPCYAERTVPDLKRRIRWYIDAGAEPSDYPRGAVVLAAHSQGTVISAAALVQLADPEEDPRILQGLAYLSYGCVLRRLYTRYFPAYFGIDKLGEVAEALRRPGVDGQPLRWRNLWRLSDYLGGPVNTAQRALPGTEPIAGMALDADTELDQYLVDPRYAPQPGDLSDPLPGRHSDYPRDPAFQANVGVLAERLPLVSKPEPGAGPPTVM